MIHMKKVFLIGLIPFLLTSCHMQSTEGQSISDNVVIYFEHYYPAPFKTKAGFHKSKYSVVVYANEEGQISEFTPNYNSDTLTISCKKRFTEIALGYHTFEYAFYPLMKGDTIVISIDSLDYPIVKSKIFPELNEVYDANRLLRNAYTIETLEAGTILGDADFYKLALNRDLLKRISPDHLYLSSYPVDSVESLFQNYVANYTNTMNDYLSTNKVGKELYDYYMAILDYKKEYAYYNERDTTYYHLMEAHFSDDFSAFPSYSIFLDYYLQLYNQHIPSIKASQGSYKDWRISFDDIEYKSIPTKTKHMLLKKCIEPLPQYFDAETANEYLQKYRLITGDEQLTEEVTTQYNLLADKSQLLLHDLNGYKTDFKALMEKYKGKVVYVDFWASWCAPCLAQMPYAAKLRQKYADQDVVFLYFALNDQEEAWHESSIEEGLSNLPTNFFIENSKTCDLLKELNVSTIPRYLLFNRQGELSNANAPRPSDEQIIEDINHLLN